MILNIERFDQDTTGNIAGPVVQVSDDVRFFTFGEQEYADLSGLDLLTLFREDERA